MVGKTIRVKAWGCWYTVEVSRINEWGIEGKYSCGDFKSKLEGGFPWRVITKIEK